MKNFRTIKQMIFSVFFILLILLIVPFVFSTTASSSTAAAVCSAGRCEKLKATLRRLETNPDKLNKQQFLRKVRAACNEMRRLKCPSIKNYQPTICFTDF